METPLKNLMRATASLVGQEFLEESVGAIAKELGACIVFITKRRINSPETVDVLATYKRGQATSAWSFQLKGTPCEGIYAGYNPAVDRRGIHTGITLIEDNVSKLFEPAKEAAARGFIGIPLWDKNEMIGHYAIFFDQPLQQSKHHEENLDICSLFGERIQAELIRELQEENIRKGIRKLQSTNRKIAAQGEHDYLTGLLNRKAWVRTIQSMEPVDSGAPIALAIGDLDHFKKINDEHGHDCGDVALRAFAKQLRKTFFRKTDLLFRIGGEEFAVICSRLSGGEETTFAQMLLKASSFNIAHPRRISITASWGLTQLKAKQGLTSYKTADNLLYQAKDRSRNAVALQWTDEPVRHLTLDRQP